MDHNVMDFPSGQTQNFGGYMMGVSDIMNNQTEMQAVEPVPLIDVVAVYRQLVLIELTLERQEAMIQRLVDAVERRWWRQLARFFKNLLS